MTSILGHRLLLPGWFESLQVRLVLVPDGGHQGGDNLTDVSYDGECERDPDNGKENTKQSSECCDGSEVSVTCIGLSAMMDLSHTEKV